MNNIAQPLTAIPPLEASLSKEDSLLSFCKASGDQLRLKILQVLRRDSFGVLELCQIFDIKQSAMSHHLKILSNAGLVTTRRDGNSIFYRRAHRNSNSGLADLQQTLFATIDTQILSDNTLERVQLVQQERAASSQLFFDENADKFSQQQEQIAAYELYGPHAIELISRSTDNTAAKTALELGPGEGAFLAELSPRFNKVYGLDNSAAMLAKSSALAKTKSLSNIELICGDTKHSKLAKLKVDCVVVNMVLHHTPSPADIFFDLAKILNSGGQIFVTDLCRHDQAWVKESCGDVWLGFEPEDLSQWAQDAGLKPGEDIYLTQRNGFRVQIRQFIKL